MKLDYNRDNRSKQGLRLSKDPFLLLETYRLMLTVRANDSIYFKQNTYRLKLQSHQPNCTKTDVQNTECTCLIAPN